MTLQCRALCLSHLSCILLPQQHHPTLAIRPISPIFSLIFLHQLLVSPSSLFGRSSSSWIGDLCICRNRSSSMSCNKRIVSRPELLYSTTYRLTRDNPFKDGWAKSMRPWGIVWPCAQYSVGAYGVHRCHGKLTSMYPLRYKLPIDLRTKVKRWCERLDWDDFVVQSGQACGAGAI